MEDGSFKISFWRLWFIVWSGCILAVFAILEIIEILKLILPGMDSLPAQRQIDIWFWGTIIFGALAYISTLWVTLRYFRLRWLIGFAIGIYIGIGIMFWTPFIFICFYDFISTIILFNWYNDPCSINIFISSLFGILAGFISFLGISFILESKIKRKFPWIRLFIIGAIGGVLFLLIRELDIYIFSKDRVTVTQFSFPLICGFFTSLIGSIHPYIDYVRKWNKGGR
ncbi:MAG: hypothetical protein M1269_02240 [Chloroflexi bacterium]|nr:hypothetical protein [Chloroflexota bacterium]